MRFISRETLLLAVLCFITFVVASKAELYVIAYLPSGDGWQSRVMLTNPGLDPVRAEIKFFLSDGREASAPASTPRLEVSPQGVQTVELDSSATEPNAPIAWATVETSGPLQILSFSNAAGGPPDPPGPPPCIADGPFRGKPPCVPPSTPRSTPHSTASITAAHVLPQGRGFQLPLLIRPSMADARLVLVNPSDTTATVQLTLVYPEGFARATRVLQISPHTRADGLVTDPALFEQELGSLDTFDGTLAICSDVPIGMLALGGGRENAFTLPVSPRAGCAGNARSR